MSDNRLTESKPSRRRHSDDFDWRGVVVVWFYIIHELKHSPTVCSYDISLTKKCIKLFRRFGIISFASELTLFVS